jgi:hypothetical protein
MTWYYERDEANNRIRLRFEDDAGTVHGPLDVEWPDAPAMTIAADGWPTDPDVQERAGDGVTQLYTDVGVETALMALRDLAAGKVEEGNPT